MCILQVETFYANAMQDTAFLTNYWEGSPPSQWRSQQPTQALERGLWAPDMPLVRYSVDELYDMPKTTDSREQRVRGSIWGVCMGLLGHAMFSMPLQRYEDGEWRPVDSVRLLRMADPQSFEALPRLVQSLVQDSLLRGALHWHRAKRHVPSVSTFCSGDGIHTPQTQGHRGSMYVSDPVVDSTYVVKQLSENSQTLPLFGFQWGAVGDERQYCPCGWLLPASRTCVLDAEACVDPRAPCLQALCRDGHYAPSQADEVEACLATAGAGVRCLEMGPSDLWGLFPVDCGAQEQCRAAAEWSRSQFPGRMTWEGIRLLSEGRAGWKLPNFEHVNATFQVYSALLCCVLLFCLASR